MSDSSEPNLKSTSCSWTIVEHLFDHRDIQTAEMDPRAAPPGEGLLPEERAAIERAVDKRKREYTAGRLLARRLLTEAGTLNFPLVNNANRAPQWPCQWLGSITHTDTWCAVSIAPAKHFTGLGIDVEAATALAPSLWESIARPEELRWLSRQPVERQGLLAKGLFSAKESIYKALYPQQQKFLGFDGMRIDLHAEGEKLWHWSACLQADWGALVAGQSFPGGVLRIDGGLLATAIALPRQT